MLFKLGQSYIRMLSSLHLYESEMFYYKKLFSKEYQIEDKGGKSVNNSKIDLSLTWPPVLVLDQYNGPYLALRCLHRAHSQTLGLKGHIWCVPSLKPQDLQVDFTDRTISLLPELTPSL